MEPDSDPYIPDEKATLSGVGPWVEHARLVLDGLRTLFRKYDKLSTRVDEVPEQVREIVKEFLEPISEKISAAEQKVKEANDKILFQDGKREGRNEVVVRNEQKTSLTVITVTAIVAAIVTAILTAVAEHLINGK